MAAEWRSSRARDKRHTHASILIANGCDAGVVSDRLDHQSVDFTLQKYRKLFERERRGALFGIEDLLQAQRRLESVPAGLSLPN